MYSRTDPLNLPPREFPARRWLDYRGWGEPRFRSMSLKEIKELSSAENPLAGKIVLVGDFSTTGRFLKRPDMHLNPFGNGMQGVELHALALENWLNVSRRHKGWQEIAWPWRLVVGLFWGMVVYGMARDGRIIRKRGLVKLSGLFVMIGLVLPIGFGFLFPWLSVWLSPLFLALVVMPPWPPRTRIELTRTRVFICYKHALSEPLAASLYNFLTDGQLEVFRDRESIPRGSVWHIVARREIRRMENFVILLDDPAREDLANKGSPVRRELDWAWQRFGGTRILLVVPSNAPFEEWTTVPDGWTPGRFKEFKDINPVVIRKWHDLVNGPALIWDPAQTADAARELAHQLMSSLKRSFD
jgi:CHASE2 domain